jgi:DNA-3-methyladenine glycosylase
MLEAKFFNRDTCLVARELLGKVICRKYQGIWLKARIIETEAYYTEEKGSHASLGYTEKRKALFMPPGTIYMYYARGKDSLNISCKGPGNAVLIKSAFPVYKPSSDGQLPESIQLMQQLNPDNQGEARPPKKLCRGQTLLCQSMDIKVSEWDQKQFDKTQFYFEDTGVRPEKIIKTTRLGIPEGRDHELHYRFIDYEYASYCTSNPLTKRSWSEGKHYAILTQTKND